MMKVRYLLVAFVLGGAVASMPATTSAGPFDAVYFFGDSLSDPGNTFAASGDTFPPSPPYFDGRLSNGPVWSEILSGKLGLAPAKVTDPLGPSAVADGINFAFAGATTGTVNVVSPSLPGIQGQVGVFASLIPPGFVPQPNALYVVWGGANDYIGGGVIDPTVPVANISTVITDLYGFGARDFLVLNLPDLGKTPRAAIDGVTAELTALSLGHNALLAAALGNLAAAMPDMDLLAFDLYSLFGDALDNPADYGLTNVMDACLLVMCANPDEYLFWDDIHPTTAMHAVIASRVAANVIAEPATLAYFAFGLVGLGLLGRRRAKVA